MGVWNSNQADFTNIPTKKKGYGNQAESLPKVVDEMEEFKSELHMMFASMQASITSELSELKESMTHLEERVTSAEAQNRITLILFNYTSSVYTIWQF